MRGHFIVQEIAVMVLASRSTPKVLIPQINLGRSVALAAAMAVNLSALLALSLVGISPSLKLPMVIDSRTEAVIIPERIVRPIQPPPPMPEAPPRPQLTQITTPIPTVIPQPTAPISPVVVESSSLPVIETLGGGELAYVASAPDVGVSYDYTPLPRYPRTAEKRGLEGTVMLSVLVGIDGRVEQIHLDRSSGHAILDHEALRHVREQWRFRPATKDGRAIASWASVPVDFRMPR